MVAHLKPEEVLIKRKKEDTACRCSHDLCLQLELFDLLTRLKLNGRVVNRVIGIFVDSAKGPKLTVHLFVFLGALPVNGGFMAIGEGYSTWRK